MEYSYEELLNLFIEFAESVIKHKRYFEEDLVIKVSMMSYIFSGVLNYDGEKSSFRDISEHVDIHLHVYLPDKLYTYINYWRKMKDEGFWEYELLKQEVAKRWFDYAQMDRQLWKERKECYEKLKQRFDFPVMRYRNHLIFCTPNEEIRIYAHQSYDDIVAQVESSL